MNRPTRTTRLEAAGFGRLKPPATSPLHPTDDTEEPDPMAQKTVTVPRIACEHCVDTIERALRQLEGVRSFDVDQSAKRVNVEWTEAELSWDRIQTHLADLGYPPETL